jgi:MtN3 and saliva related transmembrane protein
MVFELSQILGWIATSLFSVAMFPQICKTLKRKSTEGVSIWLFIIFFIANVIALIYALLITQIPLIIKYILGIVESTFYIIVFIIYAKKYHKQKI